VLAFGAAAVGLAAPQAATPMAVIPHTASIGIAASWRCPRFLAATTRTRPGEAAF
jgi:hypothetical protein